MQRKFLNILAFLMPSVALCDGVPTNLNDIPLFYGMLGENPTYHDAAFKAQQAALAQSGVSPVFDKTNSYVMTKATSNVSSFINNNTPFKAQDVFFTVGAAWAVGVKKHLKQSFKDPVFPFIKHTVDITPDTQSTGISVSF